MTITEALIIPKGMNLEEYEKLLYDKHKLEKQIAKLSDTIQSEVDCLEILSDEVGSLRYKKHLQSKEKAEYKRVKLVTDYQAILERIVR